MEERDREREPLMVNCTYIFSSFLFDSVRKVSRNYQVKTVTGCSCDHFYDDRRCRPPSTRHARC